MPTFALETRSRDEQTAFNLRHWDEVLANPEFQKVSGRVETDRRGRVITSPPPAPRHSLLQGQLVFLLRQLMPAGKVLPECAVSTADGVKGVDVAWASPECWSEVNNRAFFVRSPEICIEVISPGNSEEEIREKMTLYFEAGAKEVWICGISGAMSFWEHGGVARERSKLCPDFPNKL